MLIRKEIQILQLVQEFISQHYNHESFVLKMSAIKCAMTVF